MRILMVSEDVPHPRIGGLGRHALALAHELRGRGHEVDFLGNGVHSLAESPDQAGPGRFFPDISGHERLFKEKQLGVFLPWTGRLNARPLAATILRHAPGYDVVHYHGHLPWVANQLPADLPFTQTRHDQGGDCMLNTRFRPGLPAEAARCTEREATACAACARSKPNLLQTVVSRAAVLRRRQDTAAAYDRRPVIFVSDFLRRAFASVNRGRLHGEVIHNAVDVSILRQALQASAGDDVPRWPLEVFGAAGLSPYKGFGAFVTVMKSQGLPPGMRITIAGEGEELPALRALGLGPQLRLLGWHSQAAVLQATQHADVVVVPSVWDEPCATTVIEALALSRSVFALARGGTPELTHLAGPGGHRLQLFDTMPQLVDALRRCSPAETFANHELDAFPGSMSAMTDAVLAHYELHFAVSVGASARNELAA